PEVQAVIPHVTDRPIITYGFNAQADVRGDQVQPFPGGNRFNVVITNRRTDESRVIEGLELAMPGRHNVQNALAAVAVAQKLGISDEALKEAFKAFGGVKRRFSRVGEVDGVTVIDDYGHHPVEIRAVLAAAREGIGEGRVIAVAQPHRYTRLRDLMAEFCSCFNDADTVIVTPVFAAGEAPIEGVDREGLVKGLRASGHRHAMATDGAEHLAEQLAELAKPGDMVVCLGAGDITRWAAGLAEAIKAKREEAAA